jgi:hypothetical protein
MKLSIDIAVSLIKDGLELNETLESLEVHYCPAWLTPICGAGAFRFLRTNNTG